MTEKFWMSRESILEPIEKFLQELEDRRDEIEKVRSEYESVLSEFTEKYWNVPARLRIMICPSWEYRSYGLDVTVTRCNHLCTSVNVADDGRILCDHSTSDFLRRLAIAIDSEIRSFTYEITELKSKIEQIDKIKLEPEPEPATRYVVQWDREPSKESHSGAVVFLIAAIAVMCVGFMYAIKAGAF